MCFQYPQYTWYIDISLLSGLSPQASLNSIRLAMSSVIPRWAIFPLRPLVSDLWAGGCRGGQAEPTWRSFWKSLLEEGHEENPITTSAPIFMLGSSKGGYCRPCLPVTTLCPPKVQLQSSENTFVPPSASAFSLFIVLPSYIHFCLNCKKLLW